MAGDVAGQSQTKAPRLNKNDRDARIMQSDDRGLLSEQSLPPEEEMEPHTSAKSSPYIELRIWKKPVTSGREASTASSMGEESAVSEIGGACNTFAKFVLKKYYIVSCHAISAGVACTPSSHSSL